MAELAPLDPPPFSWRGVLFTWKRPLGSQQAQYEGSVGGGLWFSVQPNSMYWTACCYTRLGAATYPFTRPSKEEALDIALQSSREAIRQTLRLLESVS